MTETTKPLTDAQQNHLQALNAAFVQVKRRMDEFIAYLRAEHDAPDGEWALRNLQTGFERVPKPQEKADRRRTGRKPKEQEEKGDGSDTD